jgi:hypothetical protein
MIGDPEHLHLRTMKDHQSHHCSSYVVMLCDVILCVILCVMLMLCYVCYVMCLLCLLLYAGLADKSFFDFHPDLHLRPDEGQYFYRDER